MSSSGNETYRAPYTVVSATERGGQLLIVNLITFIVTVLSVALRVYIANRENRSASTFHKDDLLCFAAAVRSQMSPSGSTC
jgi:hypothetical protein